MKGSSEVIGGDPTLITTVSEAQKPSFCLKSSRASELPFSQSSSHHPTAQGIRQSLFTPGQNLPPCNSYKLVQVSWGKKKKLVSLWFFVWHFSHVSFHWTFSITPWGRHPYYPCAMDKDLEAERGSVSARGVAKWWSGRGRASTQVP